MTPRPAAQPRHRARPGRPLARRAHARDPRADLPRARSATTSAASARAATTRSASRSSSRMDGARIPRLADVFALVRKRGNDDGALQHRDQALAARARRDRRPRRVRARGDRRSMRASGVERRVDDPVLRLAHARSRAARGAGDRRPPTSPSERRQRPRRRAPGRRRGRPASGSPTTARCRRW